ncbi:hypothetical protein ACPA9J_05670 [Pseudomonas aeruginosa]
MKYLESRGFIPAGQAEGLVLHGRRRVRRAGILGAISLAGREKLDNLIFVINCNLQRSTARSAATPRSSRNWKACSAAPSGTSTRSSGVASGTRCSPRTPPACCSSYWTRSSTANTRTIGKRRRLRARALLRRASGTAGNGQGPSDEEIWKLNRGGHDPYKALCGLPPGGQPQGPADRHPGQDHQGLRHRQPAKRRTSRTT